MAKLLPVFLLAAFLTVIVASFLPGRTGTKTTTVEKTDSSKPAQVKKYWTVFLTRGAAAEQDKITAALIQEKHMSHIRQLSDAGKLLVAGPFGDTGHLRGMFIMDCKDSIEVAGLMEQDTAVQTRYLNYEIRPWWTVRNCVFK